MLMNTTAAKPVKCKVTRVVVVSRLTKYSAAGSLCGFTSFELYTVLEKSMLRYYSIYLLKCSDARHLYLRVSNVVVLITCCRMDCSTVTHYEGPVKKSLNL